MTRVTAMGTAARDPLARAEHISVSFGGLQALVGVSLAVPSNRVTALIGPNGAGKSTLLDVLSGFRRPRTGRVWFDGRDVTNTAPHTRARLGMVRTFQDVEVLRRLTSFENTLVGFPAQLGENLWRLLTSPRPVRKQQSIHRRRALELLDAVGLADKADLRSGDLSYGDQKLLVLARLLASDASLLMLDEPGAGLPGPLVEKLGALLRRAVAEFGKTVLLIDHNMDLVLNYADAVTVLHHGQLVASGTPNQIRADPEVRRVYLAR